MNQNRVKQLWLHYLIASSQPPYEVDTAMVFFFSGEKERCRDISNFFKVTQLISGGVRMEPKPSPTVLQVTHVHPALVIAIQRGGFEKCLLPLPFILYCLNFLPWPCIICRDMGTKKKKEKEIKGDFFHSHFNR